VGSGSPPVVTTTTAILSFAASERATRARFPCGLPRWPPSSKAEPSRYSSAYPLVQRSMPECFVLCGQRQCSSDGYSFAATGTAHLFSPIIFFRFKNCTVDPLPKKLISPCVSNRWKKSNYTQELFLVCISSEHTDRYIGAIY
jgi:hypothetical protein